MKLLTAAQLKALPKIGDWKGNIGQGKIVVKWFTPDSNWTWYVSEFDGIDRCFGVVRGHEAEFGYFSLREIKAVRGPLGLPVERDRHFGKGHTLADAKAQEL